MKCIDSGCIYRNPKPHVRSVHAYFPSAVRFDDGEMLCTMALGQAFEALDLTTFLARSTDNGKTWALEGTVFPLSLENNTTDCSRLTLLDDGSLVVFVVQQDRKRRDEGLSSNETLGFVDVKMFTMKSYDRGKTWEELNEIEPPLVGPSFELCCPITPLTSGKWLLPTSLWQDWDGYCPNGLKMVSFVSNDEGKSWPEYVDVMENAEEEITYWESKIVEMKDGRLLAVAWAYDRKNKTDLQNQFVISNDDGVTFTKPKSTGIWGQTTTPLVLDDGRVLLVYRRTDESGLWASIINLDNDEWVIEESICLWGQKRENLIATDENMSENFNVLRFGAPSLVNMGDTTVFITFWAVQDCVSNLPWLRLEI